MEDKRSALCSTIGKFGFSRTEAIARTRRRLIPSRHQRSTSSRGIYDRVGMLYERTIQGRRRTGSACAAVMLSEGSLPGAEGMLGPEGCSDKAETEPNDTDALTVLFVVMFVTSPAVDT